MGFIVKVKVWANDHVKHVLYKLKPVSFICIKNISGRGAKKVFAVL